MEQSTAQKLFHKGAFLICLDVPEGTEFGIDCNSWTVLPKFKGIKMIPPGMHYVYYSAACKETSQTAPRIGFFHNFKSREMLIKKWNILTEELDDSITNEDEERLRSNKQELDQYLGAYQYDSYRKWVSLTDHLTNLVVNRFEPEKLLIYSASQFYSEGSDTKSRQQKTMQVDGQEDTDQAAGSLQKAGLPEMSSVPGSTLRLTTIPKQKHPSGATPAEISKHNLDHSYLLRTLITEQYFSDHNQLLAELQFSFVCFLVGMVYEAFEQWKKLVHLICSCEEYVSENETFYHSFIGLLHFQLKEVPEDFFVDIIARNNFLTNTLSELFLNIGESDGSAALKGKAFKFRKHLEKSFQWDFVGLDEDSPVIVQS